MTNNILNNIDTKEVWIDVETVAKLKDITKRAKHKEQKRYRIPDYAGILFSREHRHRDGTFLRLFFIFLKHLDHIDHLLTDLATLCDLFNNILITENTAERLPNLVGQ